MASEQERTGRRLGLISSRKAYLSKNGNVHVPMWIARNGEHVTGTEMVLLPSGAELLQEQLAEASGAPRSLFHALFRARGPATADAAIRKAHP
ncbi:hypothetical protein [Streptomyces sp. NPDC050504]|uniref:hypothetical protein n=1 Tax=Streptomyces sp. NPDC050504 TaxID=3365618 RepID=UPI00378B424B